MKIYENHGAQGDLMFVRVDSGPYAVDVPSDLTEARPEKGRVIVAHSETGHNHEVDAVTARLMEGRDPLVAYLMPTGPGVIAVEHLRPWDTHETVGLSCPTGKEIWEVRRQEEWTPEGWRRVED